PRGRAGPGGGAPAFLSGDSVLPDGECVAAAQSRDEARGRRRLRRGRRNGDAARLNRPPRPPRRRQGTGPPRNLLRQNSWPDAWTTAGPEPGRVGHLTERPSREAFAGP